MNNEFSSNCVAGNESATSQLAYVDVVGITSLTEIESINSTLFHSNVQAQPKFVSISPSTKSDFALAADSQCRNKGGDLTKTINSGMGKTLRVADAGYFTDGFGVVEGDTIRVGINPAVRIMNIYYATNEVTVDRNISWSSNNGVNLDFSGARPDIGAIDAAIFTIPSPPTQFQVR